MLGHAVAVLIMHFDEEMSLQVFDITNATMDEVVKAAGLVIASFTIVISLMTFILQWHIV